MFRSLSGAGTSGLCYTLRRLTCSEWPFRVGTSRTGTTNRTLGRSKITSSPANTSYGCWKGDFVYCNGTSRTCASRNSNIKSVTSGTTVSHRTPHHLCVPRRTTNYGVKKPTKGKVNLPSGHNRTSTAVNSIYRRTLT